MMSATPPRDKTRQHDEPIEARAEAEAAPAASGSRSRTWAHGVPALRLQRARWRLSGRPATLADAVGGEGASHSVGALPPVFPPHIRQIRAVVGLGLLVLAWGGALVVYLLARATFAPLARSHVLMVLAQRLAEGMGACLLAVVVTTLLLVGSFALSLAVRPSDPEPQSRSGAGDAEE